MQGNKRQKGKTGRQHKKIGLVKGWGASVWRRKAGMYAEHLHQVKSLDLEHEGSSTSSRNPIFPLNLQ